MPDNKPEADLRATIVDLATEITGLKKQMRDLVKSTDEIARNLQDENKQLKEELKERGGSSISMEYIASFVKRELELGKVPIPQQVLIRCAGLPISVICYPENIYIDGSLEAIHAKVFFTSDGSTWEVNFILGLIPGRYGDKDFYPDFHMGFEKPVPVTRSPKPKGAGIERKIVPG